MLPNQRTNKTHYQKIWETRPGLLSSLEALRTVIYLTIMLTSSSLRKMGVIITLFDNCEVVFLTTLPGFV